MVGIIVIIWGILCISSIRTCIGIKNPKEITGKDSPDIRSGNVVSIEYDYFFDGRFVSGYVFGRDHYYELLKLSNKEEYLYCVFIGESESFLEDKTYYRLCREIKKTESEDRNIILGKVRRTRNSTKERLKKKVSEQELYEELYRYPNTESNTAYDYYIQDIDPEEELNRLWGRITLFVLLIILWFGLFNRLRIERNAYAFCLNQERIKEETLHRIEVEKQIKEAKKFREQKEE